MESSAFGEKARFLFFYFQQHAQQPIAEGVMIYARISYCINIYIYCTFTVYMLSQISISLSLRFPFLFVIFGLRSPPFSHRAFLIDYIVDRDPFALHDTAGRRRSGRLQVPAGGEFFFFFSFWKLPESLAFSFFSYFDERKRESKAFRKPLRDIRVPNMLFGSLSRRRNVEMLTVVQRAGWSTEFD